jgi:hypothetical protein
MTLRGFPGLQPSRPSWVPQGPKGDLRVSGGIRALTGGARGPLLSVSGHIVVLETLRSPLCLPRPLALAAETLRPL